MDIWIIRNGQKTGPIPDYEIRHRIESGEITAETRVWHDGLADWTAISQIPLYQADFQKKSLPLEVPGPPPVAPGKDIPAPPPLPGQPGQASYIRRFWARWLDLHLYASVWWLGMWAAGRDIESIFGNPWLIYSLYVPWFVLEALLIHRFATTPGKWLLGIHVLNDDGSQLSLKAATWRSIRVLTIGIGLGWFLLALFCQALSLITARRLGRPIWDHFGGHRSVAKPLQAWGIIATIVGFIIALQLQMAVIAPFAVEQASTTFPQFKERFEKNPPWQLPRRGGN